MFRIMVQFLSVNSKNKNRLPCRLVCAAVFAAAMALTTDAFASGADYKLKAAYIYQFTKFVRWPDAAYENNQTPIKICVLGKSPFGKSLDTFSSRVSQNKSLSVEHLQSIKNIEQCHAVYICQSERKKLPKILEVIKRVPVLSISDMNDFAERGGMIGFKPKNRKVGIVINVNAAQMAGIKISSKLLEVSTVIDHDAKEETP